MTATATTEKPLLDIQNISKYFGSVIALKDVSMFVRAGEVTCLLGDNGAGKSTLIKILSGVYKADEGAYDFDGEQMEFTSPRDALELGIATVYQDLAMIPLMSVWRNFFLGSEPTSGWGPFKRFAVDDAKQTTKDELGKMGIDIRDRRSTGGHPLRRRAPVGGDRPRRVFRRPGADPRRADGRPGRQTGRRCAPLHRAGEERGHRRDLHHPQPASRLPGG